jgi:hypothetical protein
MWNISIRESDIWWWINYQPNDSYIILEINQTFVFSVSSQVTDICVGEKGKTQAGSDPASLAIAASVLTNYTTTTMARYSCRHGFCYLYYSEFFSLFEVCVPMLAWSFNLQAGTSTHPAYCYSVHIRAPRKVNFVTRVLHSTIQTFVFSLFSNIVIILLNSI